MNAELFDHLLLRVFLAACFGITIWIVFKFPYRAVWQWLTSVKPVVVDGLLYVVIAFFTSLVGLLAQDEAYKWLNPYLVYFGKTFGTLMLATATALKMFRSSSYADHRAAEDEKEKCKTP